jgi:nucleoporin SEH1
MEILGEFQANHDDLIHDLRYNFYGNKIATCSTDQKIKVFNKSEDGSNTWDLNDSWKVLSSNLIEK